MKKKAIICDLDSTLCDISHRVKYVEQRPKNWDKFYALLMDDKVNKWCEEIIHRFEKDHQIIFLTCRAEKYRQETTTWLLDNMFDNFLLYMKDDENLHGKDNAIKKDIYETQIKPVYDVLFVLEDRASVVKAWRDLGLVCLQCDYGNF